MRALVTGARGFVGRQLTRLLIAQGWEVHALARSRPPIEREPSSLLNWISGDILAGDDVLDRIAALQPNACFHLAWVTEPGRYLDAPENVDLLAASARLACKLGEQGCAVFVGVGSCFEYDTTRGLLREQDALAPKHLYSACKAGLSLILEQLGARSHMRTVWARLFHLYGPGEDERRLVASVIRALLAGEVARTTAGKQVRDYLHVSDAAAGLIAVASSELRGPVNIGSGTPVQVADIVRLIANLIGRPEGLRLGALSERPDDPPFVCADITRLRTTAWTPAYTLEKGLADTVAWWRARFVP